MTNFSMDTAAALGYDIEPLWGLGANKQHQNTDPRCRPIYQESPEEVIDAELTEVIGSFSEQDVAVYLQLLSDGTPHGISASGAAGEVQASTLAAQLAGQCGWSADSLVIVAASQQGVVQVHPTGETLATYPAETLDMHESELAAGLNNPAASEQDVVATYLGKVEESRPGETQGMLEAVLETQGDSILIGLAIGSVTSAIIFAAMASRRGRPQ